MSFDPGSLAKDVPLGPLTTLGLGGPAAFFFRAHTGEELRAALAWAKGRGVGVFVLGGGSNVVIADSGFDGLVVKMETRGIAATSAADAVEYRVAAGEPWDPFVADVVGRGLAGIECLAGIPGLVGATPIQNVGAYGQDVSQTIARVNVLNRQTLNTTWLTPAQLRFGYRDSWLRRNPDFGVVLEVVFRLQPRGAARVRYGELSQALAAHGAGAAADLTLVRATVLGLRRKKSMVLDASDPNTRSAGSFFTNPIVPADVAARVVQVAIERGLARAAADVPQWPVDDNANGAPGAVKLAAGWLIERAGFSKGHRMGAVGLSSAHALALVNHGGTTAELVAFARHVRDRVDATFGVQLMPEPIFVGGAL